MHKQIILVRTDLKMRKGKIASQVAHASMAAIITDHIVAEKAYEWLDDSFTKIVLAVNSEEELIGYYEEAKEAEYLCSLIQDNGDTVFNGVKTYTAVAIGPDTSDKIDLITGNLRLL